MTEPPDAGPGRVARVADLRRAMLATGRPSSSATTMAIGVRMPLPMSCTPFSTSTRAVPVDAHEDLRAGRRRTCTRWTRRSRGRAGADCRPRRPRSPRISARRAQPIRFAPDVPLGPPDLGCRSFLSRQRERVHPEPRARARRAPSRRRSSPAGGPARGTRSRAECVNTSDSATFTARVCRRADVHEPAGARAGGDAGRAVDS